MAIEGGAGGKRKSASEQGDAHDTCDAGGKAARHGMDVHGKGMHGRGGQGEGAGGGKQGHEVVTFDCASFREPYASVSICTCKQANMHTCTQAQAQAQAHAQISLSLSLSLSLIMKHNRATGRLWHFLVLSLYRDYCSRTRRLF